jgi:c-di-GMP-binding flagellar brake protein YcgR
MVGESLMSPKKKKKAAPNPVLAAACARTVSIDLRIVDDKPATVYRSRFLGLEEGAEAEENALLIEAPALKGSIVPVRPSQRVKINFNLNGQDNYFEATVLDRGRYQLNPGLSVASLQLQTPEEVFSGGKRGFYRLLVEDTEEINVRVGILADSEEGAGRVRWREKGIITDIGGGGLGFRIAEGKSLLIGPDTRLMLRFKLRPDEEIRLLGKVCFSLRQSELREAFFGVQFIDLDSDLEYKQNVDKILHYVAEKQRLNLGERSGGKE